MDKDDMDEMDDLRDMIAELRRQLALAEDAAQKGELARQTAGGMEMEIQDLRRQLAEKEAHVEALQKDVVATTKAALQMNGDLETQLETAREALTAALPLLQAAASHLFPKMPNREAAEEAVACIKAALASEQRRSLWPEARIPSLVLLKAALAPEQADHETEEAEATDFHQRTDPDAIEALRKCTEQPTSGKQKCERCGFVFVMGPDVHHIGGDHSKPFCASDPNFKWGGIVVDGHLVTPEQPKPQMMACPCPSCQCQSPHPKDEDCAENGCVPVPTCGVCGSVLEAVRPGKHQCPKCEGGE